MTHYVVEDDEGFWITETPDSDRVVLGPVTLRDCEIELARAIQNADDEDLER